MKDQIKIFLITFVLTGTMFMAGYSMAARTFVITGDETPTAEAPVAPTVISEATPQATVSQVVVSKLIVATSTLSVEERLSRLEARVTALERNK